jgi:hypothetical protein
MIADKGNRTAFPIMPAMYRQLCKKNIRQPILSRGTNKEALLAQELSNYKLNFT